MNDTLKLVIEADVFSNEEGMTEVQKRSCAAMVKQVNECTTFTNSYIQQSYSELSLLSNLTTNKAGYIAVKTVAKGFFNDYESTIGDYIHILGRMNAKFVNNATVDIQVVVHRMQNTVNGIGEAAVNLDSKVEK